MKNKIIITVAGNKIHFHLKNKQGRFYLLTSDNTDALYDWFKNGRAENEIYRFNKWKTAPDVAKTIKRIPPQIRYVKKTRDVGGVCGLNGLAIQKSSKDNQKTDKGVYAYVPISR